MNWVDTAAVYGLGHSEEVVGRALAPYRVGEDVFVFTKCGRTLGGPRGRRDRKRPATGVDSRGVRVEPAPARRGAHRPLSGSLARPNHGNADRRLVGDDGRARRRGQGADGSACRTSTSSCSSAARPSATSTPCSRRCRCWPVASARTVLPWAAAHGTGVLVLLAPRLGHPRRRIRHEAACRRSTKTTGAGAAPAFQEPAVSRSLALVDRLEDRRRRARCRRCRRSRVAWVLAQPGVTAAIVGARTPRHVDGWVERVGARARRSRLFARSTVRSPRPAPDPTSRPSRRRTSTR